MRKQFLQFENVSKCMQTLSNNLLVRGACDFMKNGGQRLPSSFFRQNT